MSYVAAAAAVRRELAATNPTITPSTVNATAAAAPAAPMMTGQLGGPGVTTDSVDICTLAVIVSGDEAVLLLSVSVSLRLAAVTVAVVVSTQHNTRFAITRSVCI